MIYFASDTHLGLRTDGVDVREKEAQFVSWLQGLEDCSELFLIGDIFDYWFEYANVIPKGFVRLFGQLASMSDKGVKIHFFAGNHDLWHRDYFSTELGMEVYFGDAVFERFGKKFMVTHGDALGGKLSFLGRIFRSRFLRWFFERLVHPDLSMRFGYAWSRHNRLSRSLSHPFRGEEEPLVQSARKVLTCNSDLDYIVCGHIHIPLDYPLNDTVKLIVLGQWVVGSPVVAGMDNFGTISLINI